MNLKSTTTNGFNFCIINSLMGSRGRGAGGGGVRLTWLDCKVFNSYVGLSEKSVSYGFFTTLLFKVDLFDLPTV